MNLKVSKNDIKIARGVMRHFSQMGLPSLSEYSPVRGLRVDVIVLAPSDEIWIVECKSSKIDFKSDKKWQNYLEWCDRYFYLPHRNEPRGIGGIFFDYKKENWEKDFAFVREVGLCFKNIFREIILKKSKKKWTTKEKEIQYLKRGRYVEFNLLYDRGTKFGLQTGGNVEGILMSLPPIAKWK